MARPRRHVPETKTAQEIAVVGSPDTEVTVPSDTPAVFTSSEDQPSVSEAPEFLSERTRLEMALGAQLVQEYAKRVIDEE